MSKWRGLRELVELELHRRQVRGARALQQLLQIGLLRLLVLPLGDGGAQAVRRQRLAGLREERGRNRVPKRIEWSLLEYIVSIRHFLTLYTGVVSVGDLLTAKLEQPTQN